VIHESVIEPTVERSGEVLRLSGGELTVEVNPDYSLTFINSGGVFAREVSREVGDRRPVE